MVMQIIMELPGDVSALKNMVVEFLLSNQLFQERCKGVIRQLIEEKHIAQYRYRLLDVSGV
jgi:hypothetical protein